MKRFLLVTLVLLTLLTCSLALAEAVDAVPESPDLVNLLTKEVLATVTGMVLVAGVLAQGIKMLFMRNTDVTAVRLMAFIVSAVIVIIAKLTFAPGFEIADVIIVPANIFIVWATSAKAYEITLGKPDTPAGFVEDRHIH